MHARKGLKVLFPVLTALFLFSSCNWIPHHGKRPVVADSWDIRATKQYKGMTGVGRVSICPSDNPGTAERRFLIHVGRITFPKQSTVQQPGSGILQACKTKHYLRKIAKRYGFHYIRVHWNNGSDYIQKNAYMLAALITKLNREYKLRSKDKIAVISSSMGGLVSRYALASMDKDRLKHNVKLLITIDSPHQGAYVPLGVQYVGHYLATRYKIPLAQEWVKSTLDQVASQQMLLYHYKQDGKQPHYRRLFKELYQDELGHQLQGYPNAKGLRLVAIANGRGDGKQGKPKAGEIIIDWESQSVFNERYSYTIDYKLSSFDVKFRVQIKLNVQAFALSPNSTSPVFKAFPKTYIDGQFVTIDKLDTLTATIRNVVKKNNPKIYTVINTIYPQGFEIVAREIQTALKPIVRTYKQEHSRTIFVADAIAVEGAPGGAGDKTRETTDILAKIKGSKLKSSQPGHCFIPTISALGLIAPVNTNLQSSNFVYTGPFHKIYYHERNTGHVSGKKIQQWIADEMRLLVEAT